MKSGNTHILFLVFIICLPMLGLSQNKVIDSLESILAHDLKYNEEKVSNTLRSIGVAYFEIGDYTKALDYYKNALKISEERNNEEIMSRCLMNIGNVHLTKGNYPLALEFHNNSLKINEKIKDTLLISLSLNNLGLIYRNLENYEKAIVLTERALEIQKKNGDKKRTAETLNSLGLFYIQMKDYEKAYEILDEALSICRDIKNTYIEGFTLNNIGYVYLNSKKYDNSLENYEKALKTNLEIDSKRALTVSYFGIAKAYTYKERYKQALPYALKSLNLSKVLNMAGFEKDIQELLVSIYKNTNKYEEALYSHQQFKLLNDSIFNKKNKEKIAQLEADYKYKRALDSANIRELRLTKTVRDTSQDLEQSQRNLFLGVIGFLITALVLCGIIFFLKLRNEKAKTQNIAIEQKLLRSQMTPHFIFNSLSVLQGMILNKEDKKSMFYLSKFSKLLRVTLENSRDKLVSLYQELMAIKDYLELQNLEDNQSFEYTILVDSSIEEALFMIPPMLIQPFVENAIEHAFENQKDNRKIDIQITYINKKLICTITDNGIGIDAQNGHKRKSKKSLATTITSERLKMLSKDFNIKGSVQIEDRKKYNEQGTIVTLVIPYKTAIT